MILSGGKSVKEEQIHKDMLYQAVKEMSNDETAEKVVCGNTKSSLDQNNPDWVNSTMNRLEKEFDEATVKEIRMNCQCGYGMDERLTMLNELIASSTDLEGFAAAEKAQEAGLFYRDGSLYLQFGFCPCPMLTDVKKLDSMTWCQCTTGYSRVLFEKAFGCQVEVELLKSIKVGDDSCLMRVVPKGEIWN